MMKRPSLCLSIMQLASRSCLFAPMLRRTYTTFTTHHKLELAQIHREQFRVPTISTLSPEKLVHSDFLVLAGSLKPTFHTQLSLRSPEYGIATQLAYQIYSLGKKLDAEANGDGTTASTKVRSGLRYTPFPAHSQGFLYFHQPQPQSGLPRSASSIRFRCVPSLVEVSSSYITSLEATQNSTPLSEPATFLPPSLTNPEIYEAFKAGYDLTLPNGIPWDIPVVSIGSRPFYQYIYLQLLGDKLLSGGDSEFQEYKRVRKSTRVASGSHLLSYLDDMFPVRFDSPTFMVWIAVTEEKELREGEKTPRVRPGASFFWGVFMDLRLEHYKKLPYTGAAYVRFELAPSSGPSKPALLLRIVKIIEPVKCVIPDYDGYVHMPKEGGLVARGLRGDLRPWICRLNPSVRAHSVMFHALVLGENAK